MNLTKLFDLRLWFLFFGMVFTIVLALSGWAKLPKKVEAITKQTVENKGLIGNTKSELNLFIMEQRTIQKNQERREELMLELIKK